jgi:hypothetical protein
MMKLLVCVAVLFTSSPLLALERRGINVGGGATVPIVGEGYYTRDETGFHVTGSLDHQIASSGLRLHVDALFSRNPVHVGFAADGHRRIIGGSIGLSYSLPRGRVIRPYLTTGVGLYQVGVPHQTTSLPSPDYPPAPVGTRSETSPGFALGGGAGIALGGAQLFVEGCYMRVLTDGRSTSLVPVTIGVRFGERR